MELTPQQVVHFCQKLKDAFEERARTKLIIKSSPQRYVLLANAIGGGFSPAWLATLFSQHAHTQVSISLNEGLLDQCCIYISNQNARAFFQDFGNQSDYFDTYRVYWADSVTNKQEPEFKFGFDLVLTEEASKIERHRQSDYSGSTPLLLRDKLYVELRNSRSTEKVYFILHIGEAAREHRDYLPGVFAASDNTNTHPCCGPVLLIRKSLKDVSQELIDAYAEDFTGNSLIKAWTLSDLLEVQAQILESDFPEFEASDEDTPMDGLLQRDQYQIYRGQQFYLYHYEEFETERSGKRPGVGRALLRFDTKSQAITITTGPEENGSMYYGEAEILSKNSLILHAKTKNRQRSLTINLRILADKIQPYAVGTYCNFNRGDAAIAGSVVMEYIPKMGSTKINPVDIPVKNENATEVNDLIRKFFKRKDQNFISTRSKGIFTDNHFREFFREQEEKFTLARLIPGVSKVFIALPVSSSETDFLELLPVMREAKASIMKRHNISVYFAGELSEPGAKMDETYLAAQVDFQHLQEADIFILIHPKNMQSSTLVEAGWALAQKKMCFFFYKNLDDLPFVLRQLHLPNVRYLPYTTSEQLTSSLDKLFDTL